MDKNQIRPTRFAASLSISRPTQGKPHLNHNIKRKLIEENRNGIINLIVKRSSLKRLSTSCKLK
jgi:hypothetical protein